MIIIYINKLQTKHTSFLPGTSSLHHLQMVLLLFFQFATFKTKGPPRHRIRQLLPIADHEPAARGGAPGVAAVPGKARTCWKTAWKMKSLTSQLVVIFGFVWWNVPVLTKSGTMYGLKFELETWCVIYVWFLFFADETTKIIDQIGSAIFVFDSWMYIQ